MDIDYDKVLNSKCSCGIGLPWIEGETVMILPCEHMFHEDCIQNKNKCPLCNEEITKTCRLLDDDLHDQRFADILSMTYFSNMSENTPTSFIDSIFDMASIIAKVPFLSSKEDAKRGCEKIFTLNNMTLKVYGMEKIKLEKNKVFIANHVSYLELAIIYYLFDTGFLASSVTDGSSIVNQCKKLVPLLTFNRGEKDRKINIVDEMRNFVDEKGAICLFPEGLMKHPDTLARFRSGAFHIGRPVYGICIRHVDMVNDGIINKFLYKLGAKKNITIDVHVTGPYYPPFTKENIEDIRRDMALHGKMVMSRVSNRDIKDIPGKKDPIM